MRRKLLTVCLTGGLVGAVVLGAMLYIYQTGKYTRVARISQLNAVMEFVVAVNSTHAEGEDMFRGSETAAGQFSQRLGESRWYAQALVNGADGPHGPIPPFRAESLRRSGGDLNILLADFATLARQRLERPSEADLRLQYDQRYDEITEKARTLNTDLRTIIDLDFRNFRRVQAILMGFCAVMIASVTLLTRFLVRRHLLHGAFLQAANQQLRASEQQLHAANQQLRASEQQLRAANQQLRAGEQQLRAANQQLTISERRFRSIIESTPMGIYLCELTEDDRLILTAANPAADRLTGMASTDLLGRTLEEAFPALVDTEIPAHYRAAAADGTPWRVFSLDYNDGTISGCFDMLAFQILPGRMALIFTEVSQRRLAERELRRLNRRLDARNRELQSIVYAASHDLRSPLVNIQGFSGELARHCADIRGLLAGARGGSRWEKDINHLIEEDVPEALGFIRAGARKMQTLLDGLLSVSRIGSVDLEIEPLDMNLLLHSVVAAMQYQIDSVGAELIMGDLPPCRGDAAQINQVFSNLVANALKYTAADRRPCIRISGAVQEDEAIYCIEDNGIGIAPEHQQKIFEIFHRLNPCDAHEGEGIGLTIVSRILDRHDGRIWLESEPDKGSRFFIALPKA